MPTDCISYQNSGYFSLLMNDYLDQKNNLHDFYNRFPTLENFEGQILEKKSNYNNSNRAAFFYIFEKEIDLKLANPNHQLNIRLRQNDYLKTLAEKINLLAKEK